jgi:hypothetical protein
MDRTYVVLLDGNQLDGNLGGPSLPPRAVSSCEAPLVQASRLMADPPRPARQLVHRERMTLGFGAVGPETSGYIRSGVTAGRFDPCVEARYGRGRRYRKRDTLSSETGEGDGDCNDTADILFRRDSNGRRIAKMKRGDVHAPAPNSLGRDAASHLALR